MLTLDPSRHEVKLKGKDVYLPRKEFRLLKAFMEADGRVLTRDHIRKNVFGDSARINTRTVDQHVSRLRIRLKDDDARIVRTIVGVGYKVDRNVGRVLVD